MYQNQSGKARSVVSAGLCICIACICTVQKRVDALELTSSEPGDSWSSTTVKAEPTSPLRKATGDGGDAKSARHVHCFHIISYHIRNL